MRRDDGEVSRLWVGIVKRRVLLDGEVKDFVLGSRCRSREATDM